MNAPAVRLRVAINGFGRIGRHVLRALIEAGERYDIDIVAINDLGDADGLLHLLRYDSTHGRLAVAASVDDGVLRIGHQRIRLLAEAHPEKLPWRHLAVDVVLECTGQFRAQAQAARHLIAGAGRVVIGAAPFDTADAIIVHGVNDAELAAEHRVISAASCTSHALCPMLQALHGAFGIESALMTEIHAFTSDQVLLDHVHRDPRRGRAGAHNIIPTTSSALGVARKIFPELAIGGYSIRVPTLNVAAIDLSVQLAREASAAELHEAFTAYAHDKPWMSLNDEPLVSSDFNHRAESLIVDFTQTEVVGRQAKVFAWYDNEWGYANRLLDLCQRIASLPPAPDYPDAAALISDA
ncbi:glyceraldehyde 3-phosphate dehydrogenase [Paraperlucidibaca baekdonensis]|uniref:Glyceraldehyde 3-phosphate dehydrogenase n=1 Tax=Paraperlucidibaca baekdonensis TaxID=748120 RepID=A0A3E0HAM5_9GAMM|nr:glyceraldehyde 3-phosphate dehydrogenase NAD-binding domain-containing protein [Paraperlucidibaca baekdonensis]REH40282.1 glyceraldehyde 3-phosphate dehydrogenase [Paraperlucidibaca baekdonensis]